MTTPELMLAYRRAEVSGHVFDLSNYAACNSNCIHCPAGHACDHISASVKDGNFYTTFDKLLPPDTFTDPQYASVDTIEQHYPESFL